MFDGDRDGFVTGNGGAAGRVGDILGQRLDDRLVAEVRPAEPDSLIDAGRHQFHMGISPRVETLPFEIIKLL